MATFTPDPVTPKAPQVSTFTPDVPPSHGAAHDASSYRKILQEAGGNSNEIETLSHVGYAESGGDFGATNHYDMDGKRHVVAGPFQISDVHGSQNWLDPLTNARQALALYRKNGLSDWEDSRNKGAGGGWGQYVSGKTTFTPDAAPQVVAKAKPAAPAHGMLQPAKDFFASLNRPIVQAASAATGTTFTPDAFPAGNVVPTAAPAPEPSRVRRGAPVDPAAVARSTAERERVQHMIDNNVGHPATSALQAAGDIIQPAMLGGGLAGAYVRDNANAGSAVPASGPLGILTDTARRAMDPKSATHGALGLVGKAIATHSLEPLHQLQEEYGTLQENNLRKMGGAGNNIADLGNKFPFGMMISEGVLDSIGPGIALPGLVVKGIRGVAGATRRGAAFVGKPAAEAAQKAAEEMAARQPQRDARAAENQSADAARNFAKKQGKTPGVEGPQQPPGPMPDLSRVTDSVATALSKSGAARVLERRLHPFFRTVTNAVDPFSAVDKKIHPDDLYEAHAQIRLIQNAPMGSAYKGIKDSNEVFAGSPSVAADINAEKLAQARMHKKAFDAFDDPVKQEAGELVGRYYAARDLNQADRISLRHSDTFLTNERRDLFAKHRLTLKDDALKTHVKRVLMASEELVHANRMPKAFTAWESDAADRYAFAREKMDKALVDTHPDLLETKVVGYVPMYESRAMEEESQVGRHKAPRGVSTTPHEDTAKYHSIAEAEEAFAANPKGVAPFSGASPQTAFANDQALKYANITRQTAFTRLGQLRLKEGGDVIQGKMFKDPQGNVISTAAGDVSGPVVQKKAESLYGRIMEADRGPNSVTAIAARRAGLTMDEFAKLPQRISATSGQAVQVARRAANASTHAAENLESSIPQMEARTAAEAENLAKRQDLGSKRIQTAADTTRLQAKIGGIAKPVGTFVGGAPARGMASIDAMAPSIKANEKLQGAAFPPKPEGASPSDIRNLARDLAVKKIEEDQAITSIVKPKSIKPDWVLDGKRYKLAAEFEDIPKKYLDMSDRPGLDTTDASAESRVARVHGNLDDVASQVGMDGEGLRGWLAKNGAAPRMSDFLDEARAQLGVEKPSLLDDPSKGVSAPVPANVRAAARGVAKGTSRSVMGVAKEAQRGMNAATAMGERVGSRVEGAQAAAGRVSTRVDDALEKEHVRMGERYLESAAKTNRTLGRLVAFARKTADASTSKAKLAELNRRIALAGNAKLTDFRRIFEEEKASFNTRTDGSLKNGEFLSPEFDKRIDGRSAPAGVEQGGKIPGSRDTFTFGAKGFDGSRIQEDFAHYFMTEGAPASQAADIGSIMASLSTFQQNSIVFNPLVHNVSNMLYNYIQRTEDLAGASQMLPHILGALGRVEKGDFAIGHDGATFEAYAVEHLGIYRDLLEETGAHEMRAYNSRSSSGFEGGFTDKRASGMETVGPRELETRADDALSAKDKVRRFLHKVGTHNAEVVFNRAEPLIGGFLMRHLMEKEGLDKFEAASEVRRTLGTDRVSAAERAVIQNSVLGRFLMFFPWMRTVIPLSIRMGIVNPRTWNVPLEATRQQREYEGGGDLPVGNNAFMTVHRDDKGDFDTTKIPLSNRVLDMVASGVLGIPHPSKFQHRYAPLVNYAAGHLGLVPRPLLNMYLSANKIAAPYQQSFDSEADPVSMGAGLAESVAGSFGAPYEQVNSLTKHGFGGAVNTLFGGTSGHLLQGTTVNGKPEPGSRAALFAEQKSALRVKMREAQKTIDQPNVTDAEKASAQAIMDEAQRKLQELSARGVPDQLAQ